MKALSSTTLLAAPPEQTRSGRRATIPLRRRPMSPGPASLLGPYHSQGPTVQGTQIARTTARGARDVTDSGLRPTPRRSPNPVPLPRGRRWPRPRWGLGPPGESGAGGPGRREPIETPTRVPRYGDKRRKHIIFYVIIIGNYARSL